MQELIIDFLFGTKQLSHSIAPMALMAVGQGIAGLFQSFSASRKARQARTQAYEQELKLKSLEENRQEITNPYANIKDLSSSIVNPFANLQVATQAAEFQAEQTDVSLAQTLDTLRATGAGAGGATALAQAAARSKQGISATIEQQEAQNARLRAQGEQQAQQMKMSEAARVQQAEAAGSAFVFNATERRQQLDIDRTASMAEQYRMNQAQQQQAASAGLGQAFGAFASLGASYLGGTNPFSGNPTSGSYLEYQSQGGTMSRQGFKGIKSLIN